MAVYVDHLRLMDALTAEIVNISLIHPRAYGGTGLGDGNSGASGFV